VLTTLTRLCAPVIPFVTETMWRNLKAGVRGQESGVRESVHHCDYPQVDESLIDSQLSQDMEALLRLVSLGSAARNAVKIKVRQPLAELRIQPASDADRRAVERFADQIVEELNIKKVSLHDAARGPLLTFEVKPNPKNLGPKFGNRLKLVQTALAAFDPAALAEQLQAGKAIELQLEGGPATVEPSDVWVLPKVPTGFAGLVDRGTQLLLDARITPELARDGMAREVIRHVQNSRKEAGLEMEDRIVLYLHTDDAELAQAIATHRDYIANETLVAQWSETPLGEGAFRAEVKIDGKALTIELRKRQMFSGEP
jgi:isoleucyl-tRNA synthetase